MWTFILIWTCHETLTYISSWSIILYFSYHFFVSVAVEYYSLWLSPVASHCQGIDSGRMKHMVIQFLSPFRAQSLILIRCIGFCLFLRNFPANFLGVSNFFLSCMDWCFCFSSLISLTASVHPNRTETLA